MRLKLRNKIFYIRPNNEVWLYKWNPFQFEKIRLNICWLISSLINKPVVRADTLFTLGAFPRKRVFMQVKQVSRKFPDVLSSITTLFFFSFFFCFPHTTARHCPSSRGSVSVSPINKRLLPDYWASSACLSTIFFSFSWLSLFRFNKESVMLAFTLAPPSLCPVFVPPSSQDKRPFIVLKRLFWPWSRWLLWQHRVWWHQPSHP